MRLVIGCAALALGLTSTAPAPATAQVQGHGPVVLDLPASTAAAAMGGAFYVSERESDAVFFNPAVLEGSAGVSAALQRYGEKAALVTLSAAADWWSGGVGLGVQFVDFAAPSADVADVTGDPSVLYGRGSEGVAELAATVGYGRTVGGLRLGLAGKFIEQRVGGERNSTAAVDLGAATEVGPVTVGLAVQNLGGDLDLRDSELPLPDRWTLHSSFRGWNVGPLDVGAAVRIGLDPDQELVPGAGLELAYWPIQGRTFIARVGVQRVPEGPMDALTLGAAFQGDDIVLEWSYQGFDGLDGAHRFGIGWR